MQKEARNSNFEFKNLNFESYNGRFGAEITVLHCFPTFSRLCKRRRMYVIFEISNAKSSLKFKF